MWKYEAWLFFFKGIKPANKFLDKEGGTVQNNELNQQRDYLFRETVIKFLKMTWFYSEFNSKVKIGRSYYLSRQSKDTGCLFNCSVFIQPPNKAKTPEMVKPHFPRKS